MNQAKKYAQLRRKLLKPGVACRICLVAPATTLHHTMGRGELTLDEGHIIEVCDDCHEFVHDNPQASYAAGYLESRHDRPGKHEIH